ncbi:uncharacterized protein N0V89_006054 [Didymosphaeria variabile]|uniref:Methyltransferase small domain-containing protein n=1 Tax=Didymosphaeria variabile TaxID=1932322 RepID=A0A9W8XMK3_9PLEO|nr:uncharacterized protein N0V89_006054 [Didymosphaeria variabile]KAJ4354319.1 hypothetical protein N0V89_006054 [Didymosphaeria variabile]
MAGDTTAYGALIEHLAKVKYAFVCPSPETQGRVVRKRTLETSTAEAKTAQDFFGWNLPCTREALKSFVPDTILDVLHHTGIITLSDDKYRSTVRVSNFYLPHIPCRHPESSSLYYVHSSFPAASDAVFFGPDTYLFVSWLHKAVRHLPDAPSSIIDVCCGSGAGAIHMARTYREAKVLGLDLNPRALSLGDINAQLAGVNVDFHESNLYAAVPQNLESSGVDVIVSNPPYIASTTEGEDLPIYADGGAEFGLGISLRIVEEALKILSTNGIIMLYTGVAIPTVDPTHDALLEKLHNIEDTDLFEYTILHPDMWSEEIGQGAYADVCRIQVVGAVLKRRN